MTTTMATCEEEVQFLSNRKSPKQRRRRKTDDLNAFWRSLNKDIRAWKNRLEELTASKQHVTSSQRAEGLATIEALNEELKNLRKESLADLDVPELPAADVRQLHNEFTNLTNLLERARNDICPPSRFVFKRYREAMQDRVNHQTKEEGNKSEGRNKLREEKEEEVQTTVQPSGAVVQEIFNCNILVGETGGLKINSLDNSPASDNKEVAQQQHDLTESASLLIQNINQCEITVLRPYKALHMVNVSDCTVRINPPVLGAVHITSCHRVSLHMKSHQLRLHDSTNLSCYASVSSGPILEDCNNILFYCDPNDKENQVRDAKDFNWLKNGVHSPNYSVVQLESVSMTHSNGGNVSHQHVPTRNLKITTSMGSDTENNDRIDHSNVASESEEEDDEDEL